MWFCFKGNILESMSLLIFSESEPKLRGLYISFLIITDAVLLLYFLLNEIHMSLCCKILVSVRSSRTSTLDLETGEAILHLLHIQKIVWLHAQTPDLLQTCLLLIVHRMALYPMSLDFLLNHGNLGSPSLPPLISVRLVILGIVFHSILPLIRGLT